MSNAKKPANATTKAKAAATKLAEFNLAKKRVIAEVFIKDGKYDFKYRYLSQSEGMALISILLEMQNRVREAVFGKSDKPA